MSDARDKIIDLLKLERARPVQRPDCVKWYYNGELHRDHGPAVEYSNGTKEWWVDGKLHREDGPAIEWADGSKWWYKHGDIHREDGPAIEPPDGRREWWVNGKPILKPQKRQRCKKVLR